MTQNLSIGNNWLFDRYTKGLTIGDAKDTPYQAIHQWSDETFVEPVEEIGQNINRKKELRHTLTIENPTNKKINIKVSDFSSKRSLCIKKYLLIL